MANNYTQITPDRAIITDKETADKLSEILESAYDNDLYHGFQSSFYANGLDKEKVDFYLYAEENGNEEDLPDEFLTAIGKVIKDNNFEYWEFGYAYTCDKMRAGEFGGGYFRINTEGKIIYPQLVWS